MHPLHASADQLRTSSCYSASFNAYIRKGLLHILDQLVYCSALGFRIIYSLSLDLRNALTASGERTHHYMLWLVFYSHLYQQIVI